MPLWYFSSIDARSSGWIASAHKFGFRFYELELRLARGEIDLWSKSPAARTELTSVENDSHALGALLFVNQAQALLQGK